jgi:hypothetical protein
MSESKALVGCPLCGRSAEISSSGDGHNIDCRACGKFTATRTFITSGIDPELKNKIGFWTRDQNELGDNPIVSTHTVELVRALPDKSVRERVNRLLTYGIRAQKALGLHFSPRSDSIVGYTHSRTAQEVIELARLLEHQGFLRGNFDANHAQVTAQGFIHASETPVGGSVSGFIAMWFDRSMETARTDGLERAIRFAGYEPVIVSGVEHINKIDDEIVSQIRKSKFLVADFTGHRGGVYFEAGFAMGLGLPVFWTCRADHLAQLHFDIRQYNCIDWANDADLATRLQRRIEAVIGRGPLKAAS